MLLGRGQAAYGMGDKNMQGFERVTLSDHEFAAYLRKRGAIDNYKHVGNSVQWRDDTDVVVAVAFYDNKDCTRDTWVLA